MRRIITSNDRSAHNKQTSQGELRAVPGDLSGFVPGHLMQSALVCIRSEPHIPPGDNSEASLECHSEAPGLMRVISSRQKSTEAGELLLV